MDDLMYMWIAVSGGGGIIVCAVIFITIVECRRHRRIAKSGNQKSNSFEPIEGSAESSSGLYEEINCTTLFRSPNNVINSEVLRRPTNHDDDSVILSTSDSEIQHQKTNRFAPNRTVQSNNADYEYTSQIQPRDKETPIRTHLRTHAYNLEPVTPGGAHTDDDMYVNRQYLDTHKTSDGEKLETRRVGPEVYTGRPEVLNKGISSSQASVDSAGYMRPSKRPEINSDGSHIYAHHDIGTEGMSMYENTGSYKACASNVENATDEEDLTARDREVRTQNTHGKVQLARDNSTSDDGRIVPKTDGKPTSDKAPIPCRGPIRRNEHNPAAGGAMVNDITTPDELVADEECVSSVDDGKENVISVTRNPSYVNVPKAPKGVLAQQRRSMGDKLKNIFAELNGALSKRNNANV